MTNIFLQSIFFTASQTGIRTHTKVSKWLSRKMVGAALGALLSRPMSLLRSAKVAVDWPRCGQSNFLLEINFDKVCVCVYESI